MEITNDLIADMTGDALNYQLHERTIVARDSQGIQG